MNKTQAFSMTDLRWPKLRIILLSLTFLGFLGVLSKVIFFPNPEKKSLNSNFVFPNTVPISDWQLNKTTPLKPVEKSSSETKLASGQIYEYVNNKLPLEVEARYIKSQGNVNQFIIIYRKMPAATINTKIKYKKDLGYYGVFNHENKAYLTACINPKGKSTVTQQQFTKNRYLNGWGIQRTLLWIIGQQDLLDSRCLWTIMSVPIDSYDPYQITLAKDLEDEYQTLEKVWVDWYKWWKNNL